MIWYNISWESSRHWYLYDSLRLKGEICIHERNLFKIIFKSYKERIIISDFNLLNLFFVLLFSRKSNTFTVLHGELQWLLSSQIKKRLYVKFKLFFLNLFQIKKIVLSDNIITFLNIKKKYTLSHPCIFFKNNNKISQLVSYGLIDINKLSPAVYHEINHVLCTFDRKILHYGIITLSEKWDSIILRERLNNNEIHNLSISNKFIFNWSIDQNKLIVSGNVIQSICCGCCIVYFERKSTYLEYLERHYKCILSIELTTFLNFTISQLDQYYEDIQAGIYYVAESLQKKFESDLNLIRCIHS